METQKIVIMNLLAGKEWRHICREQTVDPEGKERVGLMEKRHQHTYTLSCVRWIAGENVLCKTDSPAWGPVMT